MKKFIKIINYVFVRHHMDNYYWVRIQNENSNIYSYSMGYETKDHNVALIGMNYDADSELGQSLEKEYQEMLKNEGK